jgi:GAF domain-containing protein
MAHTGMPSIAWPDRPYTSVFRGSAAPGGAVAGIEGSYDRAPEAAARLAASFELMAALLADAHLTDVLTLVVERARPMAGAAVAFMALPGVAANTLTVDIAIGANADRIRGLTVRVGTSVIGRVFATRRALVSRVAAGSPLKGVPTGPILMLPLDTGERTCGVLAVAGRAADLPFTPSAKQQLLIFATTSAILIEIAEQRRDFRDA